MELIDGVSLREILARQGKTTAEAAAHRRGVVHRDYKPENVLVTGQGASKLTDFGIAARAGDRAVAAGTLAYAPPEQFGGGPASPSGDVYAATATFYECLTGRPPFSGDSAERLLYQHLAEAVPLEPVPVPLRPLIEAGMAKDPGRRPADATILVAELRTVAARAYGPDWEERGRSGLATAAVLLAALWPSGASPAVQGAAVHRISLRQHIRPRHISPVKTAVAAGVAVAVVAAVVVTQTRSARPAAASFTVSAGLGGVAAASDGSAWAIGDTSFNASGRTLILRWNGTAWTRVPSPDPGPGDSLGGVTVLSGSDAWAVGGAGGKTLILHWNGQVWSGPAGQVSPAAAPASSAVSSSAPAAVSSSAPAAVSSSAPAAVSSSALPPGRQAAQALAALLAQSGTDRAAVTQAVNAVADCSPGLRQDETTFSNAASSHQALLGKLAALPDRSALPAYMLQDLTAAWQASGQADQDFANWAQAEISHGCSTSYQSDASYQAATGPDDRATTDKKAFAALWAAIAEKYGLPLYQYNQI